MQPDVTTNTFAYFCIIKQKIVRLRRKVNWAVGVVQLCVITSLCVCLCVWIIGGCGQQISQSRWGSPQNNTREPSVIFCVCFEPKLVCKTQFNEIFHYRIFMKILQKFSRQKWPSCWLHLCNISFHMSRNFQNFKRRKRTNITFLGAFCRSLDSDNKLLDWHAHNIHHSPFVIDHLLPTLRIYHIFKSILLSTMIST